MDDVIRTSNRKNLRTKELSVTLASQIPDTFIPPDELIEGLLTIGEGSMLYGDSNSGKTFLAIDIACAIACGIDWMGRKTECGFVIYLATESPASVMRRLQAYQGYYQIQINNLAIVQTPLDLFSSESDTNALVQLVQELEKKFGQKVHLIIGDTLARLSAGANENSGQDMGLVIRRFDRIRRECKAHFMLIHHTGKSSSAGARGWSGLRAAVDTEIEVTSSALGRCAEITKQRDLSTKGVRIGFELDVVNLGLTKWGAVAASCVVRSAEATKKEISKRTSAVAAGIVTYLQINNQPIKKCEVVRYFEKKHSSSAVYRELKKLVLAGLVEERDDLVSIVA